MQPGEWQDWTIGESHGSRLSLAPVFEAEIFRDGEYWRATLNGERLSAHPTIEDAKARCDWEIWNRVRQFKSGWLALLARRESWKNGNA
jgi:hypothetical protein